MQVPAKGATSPGITTPPWPLYGILSAMRLRANQ